MRSKIPISAPAIKYRIKHGGFKRVTYNNSFAWDDPTPDTKSEESEDGNQTNV